MAAAAPHSKNSVRHRDVAHPALSRAMIISLIFHGAILAVAILGLPYLSPPTPVIEQPIPIEVMTVADKSQINKPAATPTKMDVQKQPTVKPQPKPMPPTKTNEAPPKPTESKPPEPVKSESQPTPTEDSLAPLIKQLTKPSPKKPAKPAEKKPQEKTQDQQEFNALLKNMIKSDPTAANSSAPVDDKAQPTPEASLSDQMTMSDMDAVRKQLGECWKLLAGARYAENLVVEVKMDMTPDKHLANAQIVDQGRYNADSFFRAAADSVLRAVYDPHCNPLQQLPEGKYSQWKSMDVMFDPREMLQ